MVDTDILIKQIRHLLTKLKAMIKDSYDLENLDDYQIGYLRGKLAAINNEDFDSLISEIRNDYPDLKKGFSSGYLNNVKLSKSTDSLSDAINAYYKNKSVKNFFRVLDAQDDNLDNDRLTIYEKDGDYYLGEEYDKDELDKAKDRIDSDDNLELKEDSDDKVIVGEKTNDSTTNLPIEDSNDQYTIEKVNNKHYKVLKNGEYTYDLEQKGSNWQCSCTGFKYRHSCKHLGLLQDVLPKRHPRSELEAFLPQIEQMFNSLGYKWEIVGSFRRQKSTWKDIDILVQCTSSEFKDVLTLLQQDPEYKNTMNGSDIIRGTYKGYDFDVTRVNDGEWGSYLLYRTGSSVFNQKMRAFAKKKNMRLNEHGLFDQSGHCIASETEEDIFNALGLSYVDPVNREL